MTGSRRAIPDGVAAVLGARGGRLVGRVPGNTDDDAVLLVVRDVNGGVERPYVTMRPAYHLDHVAFRRP